MCILVRVFQSLQEFLLNFWKAFGSQLKCRYMSILEVLEGTVVETVTHCTGCILVNTHASSTVLGRPGDGDCYLLP